MAPTPDVERSVQPTGCCPPFDAAPWDEKEIHWRAKLFVADRVVCLFHVPLNMARVVGRDMALIDAAGAAPEHPLMLSDDRSPWGADLFIEVKKLVPGASMIALSGTFLTKVFEGPFRDASSWVSEMKQYVEKEHRTLERLYFGYTTCPQCSRAYGKNYVVMFAKVADNGRQLPQRPGPP